MTQRIGSMTPAATFGATTCAIIGTATPPDPPPKPALEMPVRSTAGTASA